MLKTNVLPYAILIMLLTPQLSWQAQQQSQKEKSTLKVVRSNDTLYSLCLKQYGAYNESISRQVLSANHWITNPNKLLRGHRIKFPRLRKDSTLTTHIVKDNESIRNVTSLHEGKPSTAGRVEFHGEATIVSAAPVQTMTDKLPAHSNVTGNVTPKYEKYPRRLTGKITELTWLSDNCAEVKGDVTRQPGDDGSYKFIVSVDGDLDYEQSFKMEPDGKFTATATIGRLNQDYDRNYVLKVVKVYDETNLDQIAVLVTKKINNKNKTIIFNDANDINLTDHRGIDKWVNDQSVKSSLVDNGKFKIQNGLVVKNYRFINFSPDEKYLGRYGRVTLYGSSCISKYLILKGQTEKAKQIIDVWCNLVDEKGGIPRSANVVGDTYISPDVRTGDMAYFLGALALYKAATASTEYDELIKQLINKYFLPLQDQKTGLVKGGYSTGSDGYTVSGTTSYVSWASSEHNFDLFQSLVLLSKLFSGEDQRSIASFYQRIGEGLDNYMWDKEAGTFNRGYRFSAGEDRARALDCSSWGALYLLKQAALKVDANDFGGEHFYMRRAATALNFIEANYTAQWCYELPDGTQGCVQGYKPYAGKIDDVQDEVSHTPIDWDKIPNMVWSEGTLGVAIAQYQMWCRKPSGMDRENCAKFYDLVDQMVELQSLGQSGGLLYSSKRIEGHFTQGEELASLAWLGSALVIKGREYPPSILKYQKWIPW